MAQNKIVEYRAVAIGRALLVFKLCLGTGQKIGDVLKMRWPDPDDRGIAIREVATKVELWMPIAPRLRTIPASARRSGPTVGKSVGYSAASQDVPAIQDKADARDHIQALRYAATAELVAAGAATN